MTQSRLRLPDERLASGMAPTGVPTAESRGRRALVHLSALVAGVVSTAYLAWRATDTVDLRVWWVSVPLLLLEAHAVLGLALFALPLWDLDAVAPPAPVEDHPLKLAILIPTYNEPVEILLPTVAAAVSVALAHETWVLDDGDRPAVAELAASLGARYLTRAVHDHAKAGNVNHALGVVDADVVALLDADHVAHRDLFRNTLGYFQDPLVALVQTPQDFYNTSSFEHQSHVGLLARLRRRVTGTSVEALRFSEQELFYRALQPGRNRWNAAFWCGTGAVVLMDALREVGGLAVETVTEDIHTTIRLHRRGWKTRYHNEVLARGLAAANASQYLEQRVRWGTGAMQVLRKENPALVSGLTLTQRLSYLGTLLGWFDAWRSLGYVLAPMAVILTGAVPVQAPLRSFLLHFGAAFLTQRLALRMLSRGLAPQGIATVFEFVRMPANLRATLRLLSGRERGFTVTAKGRTGRERATTPVPPLLVGLVVLSGVCAGWFLLTVLGLTPLTYGVPWAAYGSMFWLAVNAVLLFLAIRRITSEQYGAERRASVRFDVRGTGTLAGHPVLLVDASLTGLQVALPFTVSVPLERGATTVLELEVGAAQVRMETIVRSCRPQQVTGWMSTLVVGLELAEGQVDGRARLALALFATGAAALPLEGADAEVAAATVAALVPVQGGRLSAADREMAQALQLAPHELPGGQQVSRTAPTIAEVTTATSSGVLTNGGIA